MITKEIKTILLAVLLEIAMLLTSTTLLPPHTTAQTLSTITVQKERFKNSPQIEVGAIPNSLAALIHRQIKFM